MGGVIRGATGESEAGGRTEALKGSGGFHGSGSGVDAHGHEHVEETSATLDDTRTDLINEVEGNFITEQIAQGRHEDLRIEGHHHVGSLVADRDAFTSFAN